MSLTIEQTTEKLKAIASIPQTALKNASLKELKELCKGVVKGYSKLTKQQMIDALSESIRDIKSETEVIEAETVLDEVFEHWKDVDLSEIPSFNASGENTDEFSHPSNLAKAIYLYLKKTTVELVKQQESNRIGDMVESLYVDIAVFEAKQNYKPTTKLSRRTDIINTLKLCLKYDKFNICSDEVEFAIDSFIGKFRKNLEYRAYSLEKNSKQKIDVSDKNRERKEVHIRGIYDESLNTLTNLDNSRWENIAKAIAFSTGRRPSEIMCSGQFKEIGRNWFEFKGQAKRRENWDSEEVLIIPTILPSHLIIAAIEKLDSMGKRLPYDGSDKDSHRLALELADKKFSKPLSRSCRMYSMKEYRAIYSELSYTLFAKTREAEQLYKVKNPTSSYWSNLVLGHDIKQSGSSATYNRYYFPDEQVQDIKLLIQTVR